MIKPSVGRKVWYRPGAFDKLGFGAMQCPTDAPLDATVVCVHSDRLINLVVFDSSGNMHKRTSVTLLQDDDQPNADINGVSVAHAEWMPYQIKTAEQAAQ